MTWIWRERVIKFPCCSSSIVMLYLTSGQSGHLKSGLNYRIESYLFPCHWIAKAAIGICLVQQKILNNLHVLALNSIVTLKLSIYITRSKSMMEKTWIPYYLDQSSNINAVFLVTGLAYVARVRFPHSVAYVDWVCWFSTLPWEVFPQVLQFSPLIKNQHLISFELIWFVNNNCRIVIWAMLIWFPLEL